MSGNTEADAQQRNSLSAFHFQRSQPDHCGAPIFPHSLEGLHPLLQLDLPLLLGATVLLPGLLLLGGRHQVHLTL